MTELTLALPTMEKLQQHVHTTLCGHDNLDPEQTPMTQAVLAKREKTCGMFFQAHGPRLLRNTAVWAGDEDRILFYDSNGERFAETHLSESPDPVKAAA